jgi:hypothetical protein
MEYKVERCGLKNNVAGRPGGRGNASMPGAISSIRMIEEIEMEAKESREKGMLLDGHGCKIKNILVKFY